MVMVNFICHIFVVALVAAFILTLLYKWEVVEYIQVRGCRLLSKMAHCNFCLSWWTCVVVVATLVALDKMELFNGILVAVCATPITKKIV